MDFKFVCTKKTPVSFSAWNDDRMGYVRQTYYQVRMVAKKLNVGIVAHMELDYLSPLEAERFIVGEAVDVQILEKKLVSLPPAPPLSDESELVYEDA